MSLTLQKREARSLKEFRKEVESNKGKLLKLINEWRKKHNIQPLSLSEMLGAVDYLQKKGKKKDPAKEAILDQVDDALSVIKHKLEGQISFSEINPMFDKNK